MDTTGRDEPLYSASLATWFRLVMGIVGGLVTLTLGSAVLLALASGDRPYWPGVAIVAPILIFVPVIIILGTRQRFTVTKRGIVITGIVRTVKIPWEHVTVVEIDQSLMRRGGTVVVTMDGRRIGSAITQSRYAFHRGESPYDHGPDLLHPARPTRAAIAAHRQFLRESSARGPMGRSTPLNEPRTS